MTATLTLGCLKYTLNPSNAPVCVYLKDTATWRVTSNTYGGTIDHLTVRTDSIPTKNDGGASGNTVTFGSKVTNLKVDLSTGPKGDSKDCLTFEDTVASSTVTTGNNSSTSGDYIQFNKTVSSTTVTTSAKSDTVIFGTYSNVSTSTISLGAGGDSIRFYSSSKVGPGTVIDLGVDSSIDTIRVAANSTFKASGVQIQNFVEGQDRIIVGSTTITSKAVANSSTYFDGGITFT